MSTTYRAPAGLEHKAASASPESGLLEADDATGVVEAIVSVTGLLDEDRDVIKPGAYAKTLTKRKPKGIFVHDWSKWVARTEHIEELMPGDPRLPPQTKDGRPWPREAGGLFVRARFNLGTAEGRDAYSNVKFFSESGECEWSVGYKVPPGKSLRTKTGERHIEEIDLYEYSPVLFGAAPLSGTLSVKSASSDRDGQDDDADLSEEDLEELEAAADEVDPDEIADTDEPLPEAAPALPPDPAHDAEAADEGTKAAGVNDDAPIKPSQDIRKFSSDERSKTDLAANARSYTNAFGQVIRIHLTDSGHYRVTVDGKRVFNSNDREDLTADEVEGVLDKYVATDMFVPVLPKPEDTVAWGNRNGRVERVDSHERYGRVATVRFPGSETRRIPVGQLSRPRKTGKATSDDLDFKKMGTGLDRSPGKNWVEMTGRLPAYIEEVAKSIHEKRGMPLEQAIPIAIAQVKKWASGGEEVSAATRAKAAKAVAEWEKLKAQNRARKQLEEELDIADWDDDQDDYFDEKSAEGAEEESGAFPFLPGTFEELREQIAEGAMEALSHLSADVSHVEVMGTWPDRTVVTAWGPGQKAASYELPFEILDGELLLDEPVPVELKVSVDDVTEDAEDLLPYPSLLEEVTIDLKALLHHGETKAGRVLSAINEKRLLAAVTSLVAVLKAAGLDIDATPRVEQEEQERVQHQDATQQQDSTAPSVQVRAGAGKTLLNPELLARGYRLIGEAHAMRDS